MSVVRPALVGLAGPELRPAEADLLERLRPEGVLLFERNFVDRAQTLALVEAVRTALGTAGVARPLVATDAEGGLVFPAHRVADPGPSAATLGWIDDVALTRDVHRTRGLALRELGVDLVLAPVADVDVPGNPVIGVRAFGRDPARVTRHVVAAIEGLRAGGVLTCAKHWPGHGATRLDSHLTLPTVERDADALASIDGAPFRAAVAAGVDTLMLAHVHVPAWQGEPVRAVGVDAEVVRRIGTDPGFAGPRLSDAVEMHGLRPFGPMDLLGAGLDLVLFAAPIERGQEALRRLTPRPPLALERPTVTTDPAAEFVWSRAARIEGPARGRVPDRWWLIDAAGDDRLLRIPDDDGTPLESGVALGEDAWAEAWSGLGAQVRVIRPEALASLPCEPNDGVALLAARAGRFTPWLDRLPMLEAGTWVVAGAAALDRIELPRAVRGVRTPEIRPQLLQRILSPDLLVRPI